MDFEEKALSAEVEEIISKFEGLNGKEQLEIIKVILEKFENGEVIINNKAIYPSEIGIEDGFACCRAIAKLLK